LFVCLLVSVLFRFAVLEWNTWEGSGIHKDGGRECTQYHSFERKPGEKSEVLSEEGGMHLRSGEEGLGKPNPYF
jgi:hypothetical protein